MSSTLAIQVGNLARRSVVRTLRQPAMVIPSLVFPMILWAINSGGLKPATQLPGFPTDSYLTFALAVTFVQGALFAAMSAGTNVANDVETGFLNRLSLTPLRRASLLIGQLAGVVTLGLIQSVTFVTVGAIAGAHFKAGVLGALVIVALALLISLAFGSLGAFAALRTGSAEAVQGTFPLFFALLFFSSAFFPRETMTGWFKVVADANPISYLVEAMRDQIVTGVELRPTLIGLGVVIAMAAAAVAGSHMAFRSRLRSAL